MSIQSELCNDFCLVTVELWSALSYCVGPPSMFCPLTEKEKKRKYRKHVLRLYVAGKFTLKMPLFHRTGRQESRQDESVCVCVLICSYTTCHVAVYQLWSDGSTAIDIDEIGTWRVAFVFVCFTGLLVYRWGERDSTIVTRGIHVYFIITFVQY